MTHPILGSLDDFMTQTRAELAKPAPRQETPPPTPAPAAPPAGRSTRSRERAVTQNQAKRTPAPAPALSSPRKTSAALPADCIATLRDEARRQGRPQSEALLVLLARFDTRAEPATPTDMIQVGDFTIPAEQPDRSPASIVTLRLSPANLKVIDDLADRLGYPSRSALMAAALRHSHSTAP